MSDPPQRRLRLTLDLQADDLDFLVGALTDIAWDLEAQGRTTCEVTSGGYFSGYTLRLTEDPGQTGERYREQLAAWSATRKERR